MPSDTPDAPAKPFLVGYARVSMSDQNCQRQKDALIAYGVNALDIWEDKASGKNMDRPGWQGLWRDIREGDVVVVLTVDRMGRDLLQILQTVEAMKARGVGLKVLSGEVDTTTPGGRLMFNILAAMAQWERELIVERSQHGLDMARKRGVVGGRPQKMSADQVADAVRRVDAQQADVRTIAAELGVHKNSLQRRMERYRKLARMKGSEA